MRISHILLILLLLLLLPVLAFGTGSTERVVNVYSHRHYDADREIFEQFTEDTGITVNVVQAGADELIQRLEAEGASSPADLLITVDAGRLHRAKEAGVLQTVETEALISRVPEYLRDPEGYWYGITKRARVVAYDRTRTDAPAISSYLDLTDEELDDRITVRSSGNIYNISLLAALIHELGEEQAREWAAGITENFARSPQGNDRDQMKAVVAGIADFAIVNTYYVGLLMTSSDPAEQEVGEKIGIVFPTLPDGGTHVNVSGVGLTAHAPNRADAVLLMEYLTDEYAQSRFAGANYEYPVNPDVAPDPIVAEWGTLQDAQTPLEVLGELGDEATRIFDEVGWP
jgi:iron(III) transport system substrate-binding protein